MHAAGRNILSRDLASCFAPHVRPSGQETEVRSSGYLLHHRNKFFPRLLTPLPISRPSMTYNPPNAQCNKCKLFSIRLTGAFSFPSLGAFFPWLKAYPAKQVTAATLHLYPLERPSISEPWSYSSKSERIWVKDAITPNTSHGVLGSGRDLRAGLLSSRFPGQKAACQPVHCALSLSDTSYSFKFLVNIHHLLILAINSQNRHGSYNHGWDYIDRSIQAQMVCDLNVFEFCVHST